jgi:hypothetical protein
MGCSGSFHPALLPANLRYKCRSAAGLIREKSDFGTARRLSLVVAATGFKETSCGGVSPLDQRSELELTNLAFRGRLWTTRRDQAVHLPLHRLALPSPVLKCIIGHLTLSIRHTECRRFQVPTVAAAARKGT